MEPLSILGLFCEDIREEAGEQFTLIGLMPDNVQFNAVGAQKGTPVDSAGQNKLLTQLCMFVRANFDPKDPIKEIKLRLAFPNGQIAELGGAGPDLIAQVKATAISKGNLLAGVILRAVLGGFRPGTGGALRLEADTGAGPKLLASLNMEIGDATSSSEPQQPS